MLRYYASIIVSCVFFCSAITLAQTTATVSGTVRDETNAVLPGSSVTVRNVDTGIKRTVITDDEGRYQASNLALGNYEVTASLPGFQTVVRSGITLTIGREAVVDFTLKVGEVTEKVTVTGEAPLVETTSGGLGNLVDRTTVLELPLNGRDLTDLLTLQAGIVTTTTGGGVGTRSGFSQRISISGARPMDNSILMDGTELKSFDSGGVPAGASGNFMGAEGIQEFKIERNAYSAQYGGAGGGALNVVTKGGTNDFHGSAYEYLRNDNLDAAHFRDPVRTDASGKVIGKEKPEFKRNQFGFSLGGPIIKNRTFFFWNYEGLRERLGVTRFFSTFTQATRQGLLQDPRTGQFRTVAVNPRVVPYFQLWPLPGPGATDLGDGTAREPVSTSQPTDENFYQLRVDHQFSDSDSIFGRLTRLRSDRSNPNVVPRFLTNEGVYGTLLTVEYKRIFSPNLLNTFRYGFNLRGADQVSSENPPTDPSLHFVPVSAWKSPRGAKPAIGEISVTGVSTIGLGSTTTGWNDFNTRRRQYINDVVYNRGGHSWKFGFNWQYIPLNIEDTSRPGGAFSFSSLEDFLLGLPSAFRGDILPQSIPGRRLRYHIVGWYIEDGWQAHPRLTLNLGFRHEFFTVPTEVDGRLANLRKPFTDSQIAVGDPWFKNGSLKSFMPRIGLAWDPTGSKRTAIRAGFGIFYNHYPPDVFRRSIIRTAPFALETNIRGVGRIPFPGVFEAVSQQGLGNAEIFLYPFDYMRNPHMIQWNLNIQREILPQTGLTVAYVGSRGLNLLTELGLNTARAERVGGRYVFPANAQVPNTAFPDLVLTSYEASSDSAYHGLQVSLERRFRDGFQMQVSYTYARTIDEASQYLPGTDGVPYYWDPDMHRSLSAFDVRQNFVSNFIWEVPLGTGKRFGGSWPVWAQYILGGWQTSGILALSSGSPQRIQIGVRNDMLVNHVRYETPDLKSGASNSPVLGGPDKYFDTSVFVVPPPGTIGNVGRYTLIGPGLANFDFSLAKKIPVSEGVGVQFRTDIFNLLNRPNLGSPSTSVFDSRGRPIGNAGFIDSTKTTARQVQFGLRVVF